MQSNDEESIVMEHIGSLYKVIFDANHQRISYTLIKTRPTYYDAIYVANPTEKTLRITPAEGRENFCRKFAARIHLMYPGVCIGIVEGEDQ